ncbi:MAG TPA: PspA/IM30 family protein [Solirubrobacteraceae bacterium]|nr:PspA/IM30 family protein [Solirubrobacteraceae bacterium]
MGRLSTLIKAKISKLLDRAENPGETLDYAYEKQLEQIQVIRKGIVDVVAAKKRLQTHATTLEQRVEKLDIQARTAVRVGRDDLARMAIERKQLIIVESGSLSQQIAELEHQQQQMIASESQLRTKLEAFRSRKEVIKAQYSAAEAQVRISEAARGVGSDMADVGLAMQRAIDKTETMRARANAVQELEAAGAFEDLTAIGPPQDDIDRALAQLGVGSAVDADLARLKAELGPTPAPPQITGPTDGRHES